MSIWAALSLVFTPQLQEVGGQDERTHSSPSPDDQETAHIIFAYIISTSPSVGCEKLPSVVIILDNCEVGGDVGGQN